MSLFPLTNRKQIPVSVGGVDFVVYEPSALDRCEYFLMGAKMMAAQKDIATPTDKSSPEEMGTAYAHSWHISKLNRTQTAYLIAACLKPGIDDRTVDSLWDEIQSLPDTLIEPLSKAAFEVAGMNTEQGKDQGEQAMILATNWPSVWAGWMLKPCLQK